MVFDTLMGWITGGSVTVGVILLIVAYAVHSKMISVGKNWKTIRLVAGLLGVVMVVGGTAGLGSLSTLSIGGTGAAVKAPGDLLLNCPDDFDTEILISYEDTGASTLTFVAATGNYFVADGEVNKTSSSATAPGYGGSAYTTTCGTVGDFITVTSPQVHSAVINKGLKIDGARFKQKQQGIALDDAEVRVKDIDADSWLYVFIDNLAADNTNGTTYQVLNSSLVTQDIDGSDLTDGGADATLSLQIMYRAAAANKFLGEQGRPVWLSVDIGTDGEWQQPNVVYNGVAIAESKGQMDTDSLTGAEISGAEYAFKLTDDGQEFGRAGTEVLFDIAARSGQDPDTSNDDIKICLLAEGIYKSEKEAGVFKQGIYTDASSQALVVYPLASGGKINPCITLQIQ